MRIFSSFPPFTSSFRFLSPTSSISFYLLSLFLTALIILELHMRGYGYSSFVMPLFIPSGTPVPSVTPLAPPVVSEPPSATVTAPSNGGTPLSLFSTPILI